MNHIRYHRDEYKSPSAWILSATGGFLLLFLMTIPVTLSDIFIERYMDHTRWFNYYSVTTIKDYFKVGEKIASRSDSEWYRETNVKWHDILWCEYHDDHYSKGMHQVSSFTDSRPSHGPAKRVKHPETNSAWTYQGELPERAGVCFFESHITTVGKWADNTQIIKSNLFDIVEID